MLKLFGYDIVCKSLQRKKFKVNLEVSEALITNVTNRGKARVVLHIGASHGNNLQIKVKLFGYEKFWNKLQHKKNQRVNLEVSEVLITLVTIRGKVRVMLHIGASHSNNHQIILKLIGQYIFCNNLQRRKI